MPITREAIFEAALQVVDAEGLDAISMRRVGEKVGVEAMSLYHHVSSKQAILDGVFEAVLDELPRLKIRSSWEKTIERRATELRAVLQAHPNAIVLFATRPAVTAASISHVESLLAVLHDAGFRSKVALQIFQTTVAYVVGHAMGTVATATNAPDYTALDAKAFRYVKAMSKVLATYDLEAEFRFGLRALITGFRK